MLIHREVLLMNNRYKDLDLNFILNPKNGDISIKTDESAIKQALINLIRFKRGEKPFHSEISSGVVDLLFEPVSPIVAIRIEQEIFRLVKLYEPRVSMNSVLVNLNGDQNYLEITMEYTILNTLQPSSLLFTLERLS